MLYKVTPMLTPVVAKKAEEPPKEARKRRKTAIFDSEGNEVLITMMCLKCRQMKPLAMFGLRKMADGAIRNQPWCRPCRSAAGSKKKREVEPEVAAAPTEAPTKAPPALEVRAPPSAIEQLLSAPVS